MSSHQSQSRKCLAIQESRRKRKLVEVSDHNMDIDEGNSPLPASPPTFDRPPTPKKARVEDVEDDPIEREAGKQKRRVETPFEEQEAIHEKQGEKPYTPFESLDDWDLAQWMVRSGLSQGKIDEFLHLKAIRRLHLPYNTSRSFFKDIDSLPSGPKWMCTPMEVVGDELDDHGKPQIEVLELWHRDPLDCIRELLGNPKFEKDQTFKPMRLFRKRDSSTGEGINRQYDEMWTGTWWWDTQDLLEDGATIVPVILSSDRTQLSTFAGDKQAWPVYITIGNISKSVRRQSGARATTLLGYIPVPKLDGVSKKNRRFRAYQIFHDCMRQMLSTLVEAGRKGVDMACADGWERWIFPLLAAYIADYPEQCLVVCCQENSCPTRTQQHTLQVLEKESQGPRGMHT
ncbi:hypothetical protein MIND_01239100 [Mycena indigotica]|uniref:Uncharacterized protein n=1 Tax=Mycena indigotica TaxID=2126181 RepID=A0A8H6S4X5_9AGAR|nr:uncharacterized protein MIND_01239100 [Mycena indigotica]KAF7292121.1 hypothetical protein MIND_01239100 [Mycena indigotica]